MKIRGGRKIPGQNCHRGRDLDSFRQFRNESSVEAVDASLLTQQTEEVQANVFQSEAQFSTWQATVFWDRKGILLVEFLPPGATINSEVYCETIKKLQRSIQNKRRGRLTRGVVLLHDNARPYTAA